MDNHISFLENKIVSKDAVEDGLHTTISTGQYSDEAEVDDQEDAALWDKLNAQAKALEINAFDTDDDESDLEPVRAIDAGSNASYMLKSICSSPTTAPAAMKASPGPKKAGLAQTFNVDKLMQLQDEAQQMDIFSFVKPKFSVPIQSRKPRAYVIPDSDSKYVRPVSTPTSQSVPIVSTDQQMPEVESIPAADFVLSLSKEHSEQQEILSRTFRLDSGVMYKSLGVGSAGKEKESEVEALVKDVTRRRKLSEKALIIPTIQAAQSDNVTQVAPVPKIDVPTAAVLEKDIRETVSVDLEQHTSKAVEATYLRASIHIAEPVKHQDVARKPEKLVPQAPKERQFFSTQSQYLRGPALPERPTGFAPMEAHRANTPDDVLRLKISQTVVQIKLMRNLLNHYFMN
jgi:hypothetical protein